MELRLEKPPKKIVWTIEDIIEEFRVSPQTCRNWIKRFEGLIAEGVYHDSALLKIGEIRNTYYVSVVAFLHFLTYYRLFSHKKYIPPFDAREIKKMYGLGVTV